MTLREHIWFDFDDRLLNGGGYGNGSSSEIKQPAKFIITNIKPGITKDEVLNDILCVVELSCSDGLLWIS